MPHDLRNCPAMRALESLTPGGSEYIDDIPRCVETIRESRNSVMRELVRVKKQANEAHAPATPATGAIDRAILMWRNTPDETFSVPHLMVEFAASEMARVAEAAPTTPPEWTWRVLQLSRQVEEKRALMRTLGQTVEARKLDDEIQFLEHEVVNFVRNAALAGQGRKP